MNNTEGKTTAEVLALTQVLGEMVANGIIEREGTVVSGDGREQVIYTMTLGSKKFEVSLDVRDIAGKPIPAVTATAVVINGNLYGVEEAALRGRIERAMEEIGNALDQGDMTQVSRRKVAEAARILQGRK